MVSSIANPNVVNTIAPAFPIIKASIITLLLFFGIVGLIVGLFIYARKKKDTEEKMKRIQSDPYKTAEELLEKSKDEYDGN